MNLARFATHHINAILFVTVALCLIGVYVIGSFPVAILPDVTFPRIVVIADSGERPQRWMEAGVTRPLEEAIASVPGVSRMRSKTQRGATEISVDFAWGTDMILAEQLVNTRVSQIRPDLPADARVEVQRMNATVFPILGFSLQAKGLSQAELYDLATYTIRPRLTRVPGVARVVVQGGRVPEIAVDVNPQRLAAYRLSILDVQQAITASNVTQAVGLIDRQYKRYQAIVTGEAATPEALGNITVVQRNGMPVLLKQIAAIKPSVQDRTTVVTADGAEAVLINIVRQPDANTVLVSEGVQREMADLRPSLPVGTKVSVFYDQSTLIREAVGSVRDAVLIGAALAVIVLLGFLGDWIATLVTASVIPVTLLITFVLMRFMGQSVNLMTLGALAVGIGLVIDDAIVVVENIFRHLASGEGRDAAVHRAASEIAAALVSRTITTIVVFLPLVLLAGVSGAFFTAFAVTLTVSVAVSLLLALLVSPSMCVAFLRSRENGREYGRAMGAVIGWYQRVLGGALRRKWILPVSVIAIVAVTIVLAGKLTSGFMPTMDEGAFVLDYRTPPGTSLAESDRVLRQIEDVLKHTAEVETFSRRTGTELGFAITEPNTGDFAVTLKAKRSRSIDEVMDEIRGKISSGIPGIEVEFVEVLQDLIGDLAGAPAPVEVKLFGAEQQQLERLGESVTKGIEKIPGVVDVKSSVVEAGPELVARVDPVRAGRVGLTAAAVADQVNVAMFGEVATQLLQGDRQVGVRVRYPLWFRSDFNEVKSLPVRVSPESTLPLSSLAQIETVAGTTELNRENQRRVVTVSAHLGNRDLGGVHKDVESFMRRSALPAGVSYALGGQFQSQAEAFQGLVAVFLLAVVLVFAVMLFQFGSFTAPSVILLIMPLSLFGVVFGLWATSTPLNVSSFMGAIMLVGIVVKNGILLLDQAKRAEHEGMSVEDAVLQAGRLRLRPILMTTLTAILGLVPLSLGLGAGAEMQKPLAIAVIGGLSFSTLFTLVLGPLLYVAIRRRQTGASRTIA